MKNISILGSTGTIGIKTLDIVRMHPESFCVKALAARCNDGLLYQQIREFRPELVCLYDPDAAFRLEKKVRGMGVKVVSGPDGLLAVSSAASVDQVICAMVGAVGLAPIFAALRAGKMLGIANKEPLVIAGDLLIKEARKRKVFISPIDSEHSGLWQCLEGRKPETVKKLILTSSGGPFRKRKGTFSAITPESALKHPKWRMGPKITIDSATLMNKGLEVIEAVNLFGVLTERVEVLIHPEAVIHAMVEFIDGSHLAHLGITDMRLPIQYALSYPERLDNHLPVMDLVKLGPLHFEKPDLKRFPCLELGYAASRVGGSLPAVLNAANEIAVNAFLEKKIGFNDIAKTIEKTMRKHKVMADASLKELLETDQWARREAAEWIAKRS